MKTSICFTLQEKWHVLMANGSSVTCSQDNANAVKASCEKSRYCYPASEDMSSRITVLAAAGMSMGRWSLVKNCGKTRLPLISISRICEEAWLNRSRTVERRARSRMLKNSASFVLASLRDSTYRKPVRLASSLAAALLIGLFEHPE